MCRRTVDNEEMNLRRLRVIAAQIAFDRKRQTFSGKLVNHSQDAELAPILGYGRIQSRKPRHVTAGPVAGSLLCHDHPV